MKLSRRYRNRHPAQKTHPSLGRGLGVISSTRPRQVSDSKDNRPSLRAVNPPPPCFLKRTKAPDYQGSDNSSGLSDSATDDSSSMSSKGFSESVSKSSTDDSSESHSSSTSSSECEQNSSNSISKSKSDHSSDHSGLTESDLMSDSDTSFSTSEDEKGLDKVQAQLRALKMNSNSATSVAIVKKTPKQEVSKRKTAKEANNASSVESDPGFARYMSVFHEQWKKRGKGPNGPCVHAQRSTMTSSLKMVKREGVGLKHGQACGQKPSSSAVVFNKRQQTLYGDPGTFACDHADKHDDALMMQANKDDIQSNRIIHELIAKQVRKVKSGAPRAKPELLRNPKC